MRRTVYGDEHEAFRDVVRKFLETEVVPRYHEFEEAGRLPGKFWTRAGELGLLGINIPERYGGSGVDGFKFNAIVSEAGAAAGFPMGGVRVQSDICVPYFLNQADDEQKARWLPAIASGKKVVAIAMTEPGAGSDLAGISTKAIRDGDDYILAGQKTFISNGLSADLVIVAAKTDPSERHRGISLFVVESDMRGFERGRNLDKIGLKAQDTTELFFNDLRVPAANRLGDEGHGFEYLSSNLAQERLSLAVSAQASASAALRGTVDYVTQREAFGRNLSSFQNTKFELAACATDVTAGQALVDDAIEAHERGELDPADAAMTKLFCSEMQNRVIDRCLQLYGGYGYIREYPIARAYADARISRIYGGSSEIMKIIIARKLGL